MKRSFHMILVPLLLCFAGVPTHAFSEQKNDPQHSQSPSTTSGANPLIDEMRALDSAFRDIVSAVALGDTEKVQKAIASIHGAEEKTPEGLRAGTVVLPKNTPRVKEFLNMDQKFRNKLEALNRAARHNNQREMQRITPLLLSGCVKCHQMFRK